MSNTEYQYLNATGKLQYNMTNDYMFRMVLQKDKETLKNLISSLLHLDADNIYDVTISNPVEPGKSMTEKEYQMDVIVILNNNVVINLEMQVLNYNNWPIRSLSYLSRKFSSTLRGKDYNTAAPVYHVGFLDFTLFEDHPEFFAVYQMRNKKDNYLYTDKFNLYVIELNHTDMANNEDKKYHVDTWAKLFKATTWEEIKMITNNNPSMNSTAEAIFVSNSDDQILEECWLREERIAHENYQKEQFELLNKEVASLTNKNALLSDENASLSNKNASLSKKNASLSNKNASLSNENASLSNENASLSNDNAKLRKLLEEHGIKA